MIRQHDLRSKCLQLTNPLCRQHQHQHQGSVKAGSSVGEEDQIMDFSTPSSAKSSHMGESDTPASAGGCDWFFMSV